MITFWLLVILLVGGVLAWAVSRAGALAARTLALLTLGGALALTALLWLQHRGPIQLGGGAWFETLQLRWVPSLGISVHLAMDGLSLLLVTLTVVVGLIALLASWRETLARPGLFYMNVLFVLAGVVGVFTAIDLFLFYIFWELMLIPMYFLINIWGQEQRHDAAMTFFIFTQLGGLLMLLAIIALYVLHGRTTGVYTFDYPALLTTPLPAAIAPWLLLGFFLGFAVKLPVVPFHSWQPGAYTQAPTAGSILLAAVLSKTAAYGLIRFLVPLFPQAATAFAPVGMALGVAGILYGAFLALAQTDMKRLVAYASLSHLGFIVLGVFAWNAQALQGAVVVMIAHGISSAGLFALVGMLQERLQTRDLMRLGGIWPHVPRLGVVAYLLTLAMLGLPGLGNFVGEFLVLLGAFAVNVPLTILATVGMVLATAYALRFLHRTLLGDPRTEGTFADLGAREVAMFTVLLLGLVGLGLYPQPVLNTARTALSGLARAAEVPLADSAAGGHVLRGEEGGR